jgi:uncharacterized protein (DUF2236 family)
MTAEVYPAAGLVRRAAAAFAASVPEHPADDGYFGPGSVTWRLNGDLSAPLAGLRSLLVQALHPLAMAGVDQHSDWRADPAGRLASTAAYLATITYGDRAAALRAAGRVRKIHERVRGTDPVTGRPYAASDPGLLLWVHAALVDSVLAAAELFGTPPSAADKDRYVAEMTAAAELIGVPPGRAPSTTAELGAYLTAVRPELMLTPAAAESTAYLLELPALDQDLAGIWEQFADAAIASLPRWAAEMYGFTEGTGEEGTGEEGTGEAAPEAPAGAREARGPREGRSPEGRRRMREVDRGEVRQVLGVFDALYLGEPGVLEARQRIELRMRARAGGA